MFWYNAHMRKNRVIEQKRCYHLVGRLAHRAFFLDDEEVHRLGALRVGGAEQDAPPPWVRSKEVHRLGALRVGAAEQDAPPPWGSREARQDCAGAL